MIGYLFNLNITNEMTMMNQELKPN